MWSSLAHGCDTTVPNAELETLATEDWFAKEEQLRGCRTAGNDWRHDELVAQNTGTTSRWSLWSEDSFLSIGSKGSILSIGSVGSA